MGLEIFKLFGSIFVNNDEANKKIDDTDKKAKDTGLTLGGMIGGAAKWGAAIATGAGVAAVGLFGLANRSAEAADVIDKLSERTGINREELQRWKYAADQSGADIGKLEVGMKKMSDVMDDAVNGNDRAIEAFGKLGLSVDDLQNKSQEDIFGSVMAALGDMEQGAARNALGNDLLGKSYTEMLPLLNAGSDGMNDLKNRADELGLVLSEDAIKANVVYGDTLADVKDSLGAAVNKVGTELLPVMQQFLDWVLGHMPEIQAGIGTAIGVVTDSVSWLAENVLPIVIDAFDLFGKAIGFVKDNMDIILPIVIGLTAAIAAQAIINTIKKAYDAWSTATKTQTTVQLLLNAALNANPLGLVALAIGAVIAIGVLLWKNWDTVKEKAGQFWGYMKDVMRGPVNFILGAINSVIGAYEKMINGLGTAINKIPKIEIPDWVPGIGGKSFGIPNIPEITLPRIPLLAEGGDITEGGHVIVGEEGPELLSLNRGARVTPLDHPSVGGGYKSADIRIYMDSREFVSMIGQELVDQIRLRTGVTV